MRHFFCVLALFSLLMPLGAGASEGHDHHLAGFAGLTLTSETSAFTLGADYEYRMEEMLGLTALVDFALFDTMTTLVAAGVVYHAGDALKFVAAPGLEFADGHSAFAIRLGVGYDLHAGGLTLTPNYNADIIDGHVAHVFGLAVGSGF
ncbi:MAG: hypothetical protein IT285_12200 [Bdellovibrionales bacterium]|nr:hypothetical protein [Bdellovibrionales bacterium]